MIISDINQRIKQLRKELQLTQKEFSAVIAVSSGQLACIETGKRNVNDRTIKLICDSFAVSHEWLRTGKGPVYFKDKDSRHNRLLALYDALKPKYQNFIFDSINWFLEMQSEE